jgi:uncharacterized protein YbjT (DUF2867 family)
VAELRANGAPVRAFVRDPEKAASTLGSDVDLAIGDFDDPPTVRRALEGIDSVLLTASDGPQKVAHETSLIDIIAAEGESRVVKLSTVGAGTADGPQFDVHGQIEAHLEGSGLPWTLLRSSYYMTNLLGSADAIKNTDMLFAPVGDAQVAMIDPRDVAAVAARALTEDGHLGNSYVLTGPQAITFGDVAAHLSEVTGRSITFVDVPEEAAREQLNGAGLPEFLVELIIGSCRALRAGVAAEVTDEVRKLTGRTARGFAEFARDHAAWF